jgi:hypothetical protein
MAWSSGRDHTDRTFAAVQPIAYLLTDGQCEPLKAAVHGVLLATVAVCAAYNAAAWVKRRQRHLAINAVVYSLAIIWERVRVRDHLVGCTPAAATAAGEGTTLPMARSGEPARRAGATRRDAA